MFVDIEKIIYDSKKFTNKIEKFNQKVSRNNLFAKNLTTSKSTPNLDGSFELEFHSSDRFNRTSVNMVKLMNNTREKYINVMLQTYEEAFKTIRDIKILSIKPVFFYFYIF